MASLTFTNLSKVPGLGSTLSSALNNKINPQPLQPPKQNPTGAFGSGGVTGVSPYGTNGNPISNWINNVGPGSASNPQSKNFQGFSDSDISSGNTGQIPVPPKNPNFITPTQPNTPSPSVNMLGISGTSSRNTSPTGGMSAVNISKGNTDNNSSQTIDNSQSTQPVSTTPSTNSTNNGYINSSGNYNPPTNQNAQPNTYNSSIGGLTNIATNAKDINNPQANINQNNTQVAQGQLQGFAGNQTPAVQQAEADYNKFAQSNPYMIAAQSNPNVAADVASGRSSLLGQTFATELGAKQQAVTNALGGQAQQIGAAENAGSQALTGQGQQITAGTNAAQLTKPEAGASFFGSPQTGNVVGNGTGSTGNTLIDNSLTNALNIIKSGGSTTDAMNALVGGDVAKTSFIQKMQQFDPNWNPTSSNAIAQQNMSQGQLYQGQATQLDTGLKQLGIITPTINNFLSQSGLNSQENPFYNKSIKEYVSQFNNPANAKILAALQGDVKKYTAQILGATGEINPTRIGEINDSFDPSDLSPQQLSTFLTDLNTLGKNQLSVLQGQSTSSYGGNTGYQGNTATSNTNLQSATPNSPSALNTSNPVIQGLAGGAMNVAGGVENLVHGLAAKILEF